MHPLKDEQIVDTNGAGDAFAGGVLGALVAGKALDEAVEVGHKMGAMCVQQVCDMAFVACTSDVVLVIDRPAVQVAEGSNSVSN